MNRIEKAKIVCKTAHEAVGQKRKYTGQEYWTHPFAVAEMVESVGGTEDMIIAALLHDVVEDTGMRIDRIERWFGPEVARMVNGLSNVSQKDDGNRAVRKDMDKRFIAVQCPNTKTIKLADLIHNTSDILRNDRNFAKVYIQEKRELLKVLADGDFTLYNRALKQLKEAEVILGALDND